MDVQCVTTTIAEISASFEELIIHDLLAEIMQKGSFVQESTQFFLNSNKTSANEASILGIRINLTVPHRNFTVKFLEKVTFRQNTPKKYPEKMREYEHVEKCMTKLLRTTKTVHNKSILHVGCDKKRYIRCPVYFFLSLGKNINELSVFFS